MNHLLATRIAQLLSDAGALNPDWQKSKSVAAAIIERELDAQQASTGYYGGYGPSAPETLPPMPKLVVDTAKQPAEPFARITD